MDDPCIACGIGLDASMIVQVDHNPPPPKKPKLELPAVKEVKRAQTYALSTVTK